ncbi:uncharacterized protein LOC132551118 [Ylistrum balloti]|uniref:uncharacterized protein LOC132551118 n=1 Tax=Ylistrum balloti TaxID=509963 RepID=UPI002905C888|nr:uncharacterized protein LOC132551118 [Ylistrum balloti]
MMSSMLLALLVVTMVTVQGRPERDCKCPDEKDPWCGDEGDYDTLCDLLCQGDEIVGHDTCDNIENCTDALPPLPDKEVCAEHDVTFETIEEMKCSKMEFVHDGECV